tara:strand:- start:1535 stop:1747 length:213 start_codon:yes stop_codon:yes gene_type:complete
MKELIALLIMIFNGTENKNILERIINNNFRRLKSDRKKVGVSKEDGPNPEESARRMTQPPALNTYLDLFF